MDMRRLRRIHRRGLLQRMQAVIQRLAGSMRTFDMHPAMRGIVHPALHREHACRIPAEHDMIDLSQTTGLCCNGQRRRRVALFVLAVEGAWRQCPHAM